MHSQRPAATPNSVEPLPFERVPALVPLVLLQVIGIVGQHGIQERESCAEALIHRPRHHIAGHCLINALQQPNGHDDPQHDQVLLPHAQHKPIDRAKEERDDVAVDQQLLAKRQGAKRCLEGLGARAAVLVEEGEALLPFWLEIAGADFGLRGAFHGDSCQFLPWR